MQYLIRISALAFSCGFVRAESYITNTANQNGDLLHQTEAAVTTGNDTGLLTNPIVREDTRQSDYYRLEGALLKDYRPQTRPVWSYNTTTNVSLVLKIFAVHEVNEMYQTLRHSSFLAMQWTDQFLQWNPDHHKGLQRISLPTDSVWTPNVIFTGSVKGSGFVSSQQAAFVYVTSEGEVTWSPVGMRETLCGMDITFYPFDTQICEVPMDIWTGTVTEVSIASAGVTLDEMFYENCEWQLLSVEVKTKSIKSYDGVVAIFRLKRRRLFHCLTLIAPNVLLAILAAFSFKLPEESGEKVAYSMPLLLVFTLNLTVLINTMPRSSLDVSLLVIYLTSLSVITALSIITTAMTLRLYHRQEVLPPAIHHVMRCLATFFRIKGFSCVNAKACNVGDAFEDNHHHNVLEKANQETDFTALPSKTHKEAVGQASSTGESGAAAADARVGVKDKEAMTGCEAAMILDYVFFHTFIFLIVVLTCAFMLGMFVGKL